MLNNNQQSMDLNQLIQTVQQQQQQLVSLTERVQQHDNLLARLDLLEKENGELKNQLQAKDLAIEKLQGQLSSRRTNQGALSSSQVTPPQELVTTHQPDATQGSYASAARKGAQHRDPAVLPSDVLLQVVCSKPPPPKVNKDTNICFPATGVIGILLHIQYVEEFLACMRKCEADHIENFQPLDPNNIADPKYADLAIEEREQLIYEFTNTRALQTLSFLRPLNVSGVGKYFVSAGWISQEELDIAVSEAIGPTSHTPNNNPVHSFQVSLSLWNANGLRQSTVHDVLHHVQNTHVLLVTETWLTSGSFPTNWSQFHLYGSKVPGAFNRGSGGITAFVSPSCPFSVSQLPSYNAHTLSLKVGTLTVHCVYLPPPLSSDKVLSLLRSLPVTSDTILCGDFNARFGSLLGDTNANPRGTSLLPWLEESSLSILNESLAFGTPTFTTFRRQQEVHSIIDLFLTNIGEAALLHPQLVVESDLSLGSDHRLMVLTFERQWKLSKLRKKRPLGLLRESFRTSVAPLVGSLSGLVSAPPGVCPDIDAINDSLNQCLYESLDSSIGVKSGRPGHWKKYWTQEIEDAARERDTMY
ncbi:uncharacterized protein ATC70_006900, partial [Mucor velutinosus]